jgi:hypothetical protein
MVVLTTKRKPPKETDMLIALALTIILTTLAIASSVVNGAQARTRQEAATRANLDRVFPSTAPAEALARYRATAAANDAIWAGRR